MESFSLTIALGTGIGLGLFAFWIFHRIKVGGYQSLADKILRQAEEESERAKKTAELALKQQQLEQQREFDQVWQNERKKNLREEERLTQKEEKLENRLALVEKKLSELEKREGALIAKKEILNEEEKKLEVQKAHLISELEKVSGLQSQEARDQLFNKIQSEVKADSARYIRRVIEETEAQAENEANRLISAAINRLASTIVSEATVCTVPLPSDEMKGRIIGREGRNIRAFEKMTGVNFVMDDTPQAVVLSAFDPVRKAIAKQALTELVQDGRIHPTRIEEAVEKAEKNVQKQIRQYGEDAALRAGAINLHPELITLLGKLKFRISLGQNILDHSLEVSNLLGMMAAELGLDVALAKRIGLLHDIGKAVSHEMEGTHAMIGHDLALKYGEIKEVANGIGCHHNEIAPMTIVGSLCGAADAISASRPGARIEAVEEYIKRLKKLEEIAYEFPGVEKAYAMQAGREIRVMVTPEMISDEALLHLARDMTKRIETELAYPGKIKVSLFREKRVVDYAM